jgi:hypothetical protein
MISVPRGGGEVKSDLSQEQKDRLWEAIVRNWAKNNTDKLAALLEKEETAA